MIFLFEIDIMPLKELLDPKGKAVEAVLQKNMGMPQISAVRIGKHLTMQVEAADEATARAMVEKACKQLLTNEVMESYTYKLSKAAD